MATVVGTTGIDILFGSRDSKLKPSDLLFGSAGDDILLAGGGNDTLDGGDGFDTAVYSALAGPITLRSQGIISKGALGQDQIFGIERIVGAAGFTNVIDGTVTGSQPTSFFVNLDSQQLIVNGIPGGGSSSFKVFNFVNVFGTSNNDILIGNAQANLLAGGAGNDLVSGGAGNDTLFGGSGSDQLTGGTGSDLFVFNTALGSDNVDIISGYVVNSKLGDDTICLDDAVFTALTVSGSALAAGAFNTGAAASELDDRIIYNTVTGALLYDADGSGAGTAVQFATLTGVTGIITAAEFLII